MKVVSTALFSVDAITAALGKAAEEAEAETRKTLKEEGTSVEQVRGGREREGGGGLTEGWVLMIKMMEGDV